MLDKFKHLNFKEATTPFDHVVKLQKNNGIAVAQLEYASEIWCFMYLIQCARLDISFAVSKMIRFTSNPNKEHWKVITRIFGYLQKTNNLVLHYVRFPAILEGHTDATWISNIGDHKSIARWIFRLAGGVISWKSNLLVEQETNMHYSFNHEIRFRGSYFRRLRRGMVEGPSVRSFIGKRQCFKCVDTLG